MERGMEAVEFGTRFATITITETCDRAGRQADVITIRPLAYGARIESEVRGDNLIIVREPEVGPS